MVRFDCSIGNQTHHFCLLELDELHELIRCLIHRASLKFVDLG